MVMTKDQQILLDILRKEVTPATGCTEPIAVAYSAALAREHVKGKLKSLEVWVDMGLFKNGIGVGIPGIEERGLEMAAALGYAGGDSRKGLQVIESLTQEQIESARRMIQDNKVKVYLRDDIERLYIETVLTTDNGKVRVITLDRHLNIVSVEKQTDFKSYDFSKENTDLSTHWIQKYGLEEFINFVDLIRLEELSFIKQGIKMNLEIAKKDFKNVVGIANKLSQLVQRGLLRDDMISWAQILCAAGAEARMSGSKLPVMTSAGSGNHGITVFLTNYAVAEKQGIPEEKLIRAITLSNLITVYIKSFTGTLSAMCGCGVAAGIGASAGVVYMLGGTQKNILGAMQNMVGSISGIICDGAKEGCAFKLALSAGWAVQSALLAMNGIVISQKDGIVAENFETLCRNVGYVCTKGMASTNKSIIDIIHNRK